MKTVDERLFEQLMRAPHVVRKAMIEAEFGPMPEGPRGPHCHGPHHGPHGHGPCHGPGPHPAFARERMLDVIGNYEGGVRQKTLTEELRINPSSVSELVSKLESDGYVKRTVDPSDKRATLITLTELGEARSAELADERAEKMGKAFAKLTAEEKEQLLALLEKLTARE